MKEKLLTVVIRIAGCVEETARDIRHWAITKLFFL